MSALPALKDLARRTHSLRVKVNLKLRIDRDAHDLAAGLA